MKSKNMISSMSERKLNTNQMMINEVKDEIQKIKKPFLNRVQFSKLRIQSKIHDCKKQKQQFQSSQESNQDLIQKQSRNELSKLQNQEQAADQITDSKNKRKTNNPISQMSEMDDNEDYQLSETDLKGNCIRQWQGRDKQRVFKNSSSMVTKFQKVFSKKLPLNQAQKRQTYSYRKDQKEMLEKIFSDIKNPLQNTVSFENIFKFFNQCKTFYKVYDINPAELHDLVSSSAHVYPNKLTKKQFFDLILINPQARKYDELENKVLKTCCLIEQYWIQLKQLFNQLDTFGCGTVRSAQFFHKMTTVSASKQLLQANAIYYPNVNRYYSLKKVIFQLGNKVKQPEKLHWSQLASQIINYSYIQQPSIDEIFQRRIKAAFFDKDSNTFLLKSDTLAILKKEFQRCPKFCESFVKCKFFCDELLSMEIIHSKKNESVRQNKNGKGFVTLISNIRMLLLKGPQYIDLDEMLTYFSVKGFQRQQADKHLQQVFDTKSTASDEEFQERKKQEKRAKRMKSQDHMKKIMMKGFQNTPGTERRICYQPVKFQQFNLTKPRDYLTIRETKVKQMIQEKRLKEQAQIKPFVPATPLPAAINPQRYLEKQNRQQIKRQIQKQKFNKKYVKYQKQISYLNATTKLFENPKKQEIESQNNFMLSSQQKKPFEPTPISWFIKQRNLLEVIESQKQQRRKNRLKLTKQKYQFGYWKKLPYDAEEKQKQQADVQDSLEMKVRQMKNSIEEKKQLKIKTTIVPDFAKLQKQFMEQLESKKKMRSPTVVKEFNLSLSKKKPIQNQQQMLTKRLQTPKHTKDHSKTKDMTPTIVGTTKKYESMVELTQMRMAQKNYEEELKILEEKQRKKKQKAFAKFMNKVLKQENLKSKRSTAEKTTRRNDSSSRVLEHERQLRKIYEKVLSRPFLFQTATDDSKGLKKKGKTSKKNKKELPQKVKIPQDNDQIKIPPLRYVQSQQYPVEYDQQRHDNNDQQQDFDYQEESYIEKIVPNQEAIIYSRNYAQNLNQSF